MRSILAALALSAIVLAGCTEAAPESAAPSQAGPVTVLSDEGNGAGRTEQFTVDGKYQIDWSWEGDRVEGQEVGVLGLMLMHADGQLEGIVANTTASGADIFYGTARGDGSYYLDVNAANGSWTAKVTDLPG